MVSQNSFDARARLRVGDTDLTYFRTDAVDGAERLPEAMTELGGDVTRTNPLAPAELVIDHSVVADRFGAPDSFARNVELEYERNGEFPAGESADSLGLTGDETLDIAGVDAFNDGHIPQSVRVRAGADIEFDATVRVDTPGEADYYRNGGIMPYVLRSLL